MPLHERREILQYAGIAVVSGGLFSTTVSGDGNGSHADGNRDDETSTERDLPPLLPTADVAEHWNSFRSNPGNTAAVTDGPDFDDDSLGLAWEYEHDGTDPAEFVIARDTVYVAIDGAIRALDAAGGTVAWTSDAVGADGTPAVAYDTVYIGGDRLTALSSDGGTVRWTVDLEAAVGIPTVAYETVYAVADGTLYALDAADGSIRWQRDSIRTYGPNDEAEDEGTVTSFRRTAVAVAGELVYAITDTDQHGAVVALDPLTGESQRTYGHGDGGHTSVAATESHVFVEFDWERARAIDTDTGETLDTGGVHPIAATDDLLLTVSRQELVATDLETGEERWNVGYHSQTIGAATVVDDTAYVCIGDEGPQRNDDDVLVALAVDTGRVEWVYSLSEFDTARDEPGSEVVVSGDTIYLTTRDAKLLALRDIDTGTEAGDEADESEDEAGDTAESDGEDAAEADGPVDSEGDGEGGEGADSGTEGTADSNGDATPEADDPDSEGGTGADESQRDSEAEAETADDDGSTESEDANETDSDGPESEDADESEDDSTPGFAAGASLVSGAITLEWLRRRALGEDEHA